MNDRLQQPSFPTLKNGRPNALQCGKHQHDMLNVLMAAAGTIDLLLLQEEHSDLTRRNLMTVSACLDTIGAIVSGCRADTRTDVVGTSTIDIIPILEHAISASRSRAPENISLIFRHPASPVLIDATEASLFRTLINLLLNAIKAIAPNEGAIIASCSAVSFEGIPTVTRTAYGLHKQPYALIRIADSGCGMDDERIILALHTFFTTKPDDGHGYGLTVVREFVEGMHGGIHIDSTAGVGTTFSLYLPASPANEPCAVSGVRAIVRKPENG